MSLDYKHKPENYYCNDRFEMIKFLPKNSKRILDIGCGNGTFANALMEMSYEEVWGIELIKAEAIKAQESLYKVFVGSCEKHIDELPNNYFDAIYFNDVLEHLVDPYSVLKRLKNKLSDNGVIISSIPNIRYYHVLYNLLFKKEFEYKSHGILDKTHLRFFTKNSIRNMYENLGFEVLIHIGINKSKSIRPFLLNIPMFFTAMDIKYQQFATVVRVKK